jgi:hypothetical protein
LCNAVVFEFHISRGTGLLHHHELLSCSCFLVFFVAAMLVEECSVDVSGILE